MSTSRRVWVLLGRGVGGNAQMRSLAEALGWPYDNKHLAYNRFERIPNLFLGASLWSVDRRRSSPLDPPWPDLVIAGSRRSAPVARWIKRQSGGHTRLVHLMHTQAPLGAFDLIVTMPQYRLPAHPRVVESAMPLNCISAARIDAAARRWAATLGLLPRPRYALLVGGNSSTYRLDAGIARRIGAEVSARVREQDGSLLVSTSARTPEAAADALAGSIDCRAHFHRWRADDPSDAYLAYLGLADRFVVTIDSASQVAEACCTEKPVEVFSWEVREDKRRGLQGLVRRIGERRARLLDRPGSRVPPLIRVYDGLVRIGLVKPPRDLEAYVRRLAERGLVRLWNDDGPERPTRPYELDWVVQRVRREVEEGHRAATPVHPSIQRQLR